MKRKQKDGFLMLLKPMVFLRYCFEDLPKMPFFDAVSGFGVTSLFRKVSRLCASNTTVVSQSLPTLRTMLLLFYHLLQNLLTLRTSSFCFTNR